MEEDSSHLEEHATLFIQLLRQGCKIDHSEQLYAQLLAICFKNIDSLPLIAERLEGLKVDSDYVSMIDYLSSSGFGSVPQFSPYFSTMMQEINGALPSSLYLSRQAQCVGRVDLCLSAIIETMEHASTLHDQWVVNKNAVFCFNYFGYHLRAQACALNAYQIAQRLEEKVLLQRSRFSVLNSSRLVAGTDMSSQYIRQCDYFTNGELLYREGDQHLLPIYAAMHLMDRGEGSTVILNLLNTSNECQLIDFARLNNKIAWARYNYLSGRIPQAKKQIHELSEELSHWAYDLTLMRPLSALAAQLGVSLEHAKQTSIILASQKLWRQYDLRFDHFCTNFDGILQRHVESNTSDKND